MTIKSTICAKTLGLNTVGGNLEVRHKTLCSEIQSSEEALNVNWWLGHALGMSTERLLRCKLFSEVRNSWKMRPDDQLVTGRSGMQTLISGLARVGQVRLHGRGYWDTPPQVMVGDSR